MLRFMRPSVEIGLIACLVGCGNAEPEPLVIRLQDAFNSAAVTGSVEGANAIPETVLEFVDGTGIAWRAGVGVEDLRVQDGRLAGTTTDGFPIVDIERTEGLDNPDALHSIEIRARVSGGANMSLLFNGAPEPNLERIMASEENIPWRLRTPLIPGDGMQTYTIPVALALSLDGAGTRHVLLRPSDETGVEFEIESIRLIFRQEYLATIPSGISWQGFGERYRETLITRSPERILYELTMPSRPWLDLSIATVEEVPVTFRVIASQSGEDVVLEERTITTPEQWEDMDVELGEFAGQSVTLALEVGSETENTLGFWGAPVIRNRGAMPQADRDVPQGVILFVADTLRRDHLSAYGYERETSPVLTRLANEGALMLDNQAHAIWTKVSVPSIHTSLYPTTHGVRRFLDRLPAAATTLAEVYREAGYATWALSSNGFVGKSTNLHQGFEAFDENGSLANPAAGPGNKSARPFVERVIPWIEEHQDVPFFINIHVTDPHSPYPSYEPYDTRFGDDASRRDYQESLAQLRERGGFTGGSQRGEPHLSHFEAAGIDPGLYVGQEHNWYDGSILAMDVEIGNLIEALEAMGLAEEILFAFISDHGEEFLEHGSHFHRQIYGENSNVPLILWAPGRITPGTVVSETVQSIDLMPTMLGLSGLPIPEAAQGQSFLSLLQPTQLAGTVTAFAQDEWQPQPVFTEQLRDNNGTNPGPFDRDAYAVVFDGWKLVHNTFRDEGSPHPEWELYDHDTDPLDQTNVADRYPEVVERLGQLLDDWHEYALAARLSEDEATLEGLDPAELERLRSLGYIN